MNYENFCKVLDHIEQHPEEWNQSMWEKLGCGTGCCIAGHVEAMFATSHEISCIPTRDNGEKYLGLDRLTARWLFGHERTLGDFRRVRLMHARTRLAWAVQNYLIQKTIEEHIAWKRDNLTPETT